MKRILFAVLVVALLVGCGPSIEQRAQVDKIMPDGQCVYQLGTFIHDGWAGTVYNEWRTYITSLTDLERIKVEEWQKAQAVIDSGCLDMLE